MGIDESELAQIKEIAEAVTDMILAGPVLNPLPIPHEIVSSYNHMLQSVSHQLDTENLELTYRKLIDLDLSLRAGKRHLLRTGKTPETLYFYPPIQLLWLADSDTPDIEGLGSLNSNRYEVMALFLLTEFYSNVIRPISEGSDITATDLIVYQSKLTQAAECLVYSCRWLIETDEALLKRNEGKSRVELELEVAASEYGRKLGGHNSRRVSDSMVDLIARAAREILSLDEDNELRMKPFAQLVKQYVIDRCGIIGEEVTEDSRSKEWYEQILKKKFSLPKYLSQKGKPNKGILEKVTARIEYELNI
ncbi:hypothetical protein [Thalassolituus maritimus]|uniref:Uncharacterized protein n=1 Tax=Thalassolituus maritimus TaxID=484498 RepID=A0ABQ0A0J0_9GAMM